MSDSEPGSETNRPSPREPRRRAGAIALLLAAGALAAVGVAMVLTHGEPARPPTREPPGKTPLADPASNSGAFPGAKPSASEAHRLDDGPSATPTTRSADVLGGLLGPRGQEVLIPAGASPLTGEPASLPSPTSLDPTAVRESGFTRGQGAEAEEFITWRLPGTGMRAAQDFYERAAREAGLTAVPTLAATQPTAATRLMFAAPGKAPGAVLMVRIRPLSHEGTSVMLWLRPASTGSKP